VAFISNLGLAFREIARENADRTALVYPGSGTQTTYRELSYLAEVAALDLHRRGYGKGDVVAIFHDKSPEAFAAMLGCLRLGITYTNLDPESPWERLRKILSNCQPRAVLNAFPSLAHAENIRREGSADVVSISELFRAIGACAESLPAIEDVPGSTPAYLMFTSGSTGQPKGAVMSHANVLFFISWGQNRFRVTPEDIFTNVNPIYFDNSVFDFYTAIFSGAALVPVTAAETKDPRLTVRLVGEAGCTVWFSVPSLLVYLLTTRALTSASLPRVRKIIFGGEGFPKTKLKQLYDMFSERANLENVYGPTECTCICSAHTVATADFADMQNLAPLGHVSQNFSGEVLPLEDNEPDFGELLLLGPQVGLGYYNDPERTAQSFIQNPRHNLYRDIGYRTGDLVRRDADGRFHFKGRADFQIKYMGYRIELEEIEAALGTIGGVKECAVVYHELGEGTGRIVGFVAMDQAAGPQALVKEVAQIVPPYMVPKSISVLPHLPKNANGKIDRLALQQMKSV
jgi:D-alanine--poly(phosphoribitol) ligase subunit 1